LFAFVFVAMDHIKTDVPISSEPSTLFIPALSIGNVPQLVLDLFATSLSLQHICHIDSDLLLPLCGYDTYTPPHTGVLCTPAELFRGSSTALLQLRTPPVPSLARLWCQSLSQWVKERVGAVRVVLLVTIPSSRATGHARDLPRLITNEAWGELKPCDEKSSAPWEPLSGSPMEEDVLSEGSVVAQLYKELGKVGIPAMIVSMYCAEGDNVPDAITMASWCARYFDLVDTSKQFSWKPPESWNATTFWGSDVDGCASEYL